MTANGWIQILFFFATIVAVTIPLGAFMYRVLEGHEHFLRRPLGWLERLMYRAAGVDGREQSWQAYSFALLAFSLFTMLVTYVIQRLQHVLPFNPQKLGAVEAASSFDTRPAYDTRTGRLVARRRATEPDAGIAWHNSSRRPRDRHRYGAGTASSGGDGSCRDGRQLLGGLTRALLHAPAPTGLSTRLRPAGCGPDPLAPRRATTLEGGRQLIAVVRGLAGGDQAARDQPRGFLQRNARTLREPNPFTNFLSMF